MSISKKDMDSFEPLVDKAVRRLIGHSDANLVRTSINCAVKGYDRRKMRDKLESVLDSDKAYKFADKLMSMIDTFNDSSRRSRKRKEEHEDDKESKKPRKAEAAIFPVAPEQVAPSPGQLTADKIKEMMANAQKMIEQRKTQLKVNTVPLVTGTTTAEMGEKAKRAADLQARIQAQLRRTGIEPTATIAPVVKVAQATSKPQPVVLDEQGRSIDVSTGEAIEVQHYTPTLKANIRAKRREQFKSVLQDQKPDDVAEAKFFDPRVGQKLATRTKRQFRFYDVGKFQQLGQRMRTKAQLEKLQEEIAQAAKKTGIASAAKLATIQPRRELKAGEIPNVEWWDSVILKVSRYEDLPMLDDETVAPQAVEGITHLVEHPAQMKPPTEADKDVVIPVMLTAQERKKLRRQTRNEAQKDQQEQIRLGLMPPPEPKVRMANLMRVLGTEAVQDPTKVEAHVRAQMAKRQRGHEETNAARKLTPEQRREKKINKLKEDTSHGVNVTLYRVKNLTNPSKKFKIEANSKQLFMTGFVVLCKDCNVVVIEGGPKQQKKFNRLMMHRLKWEEEPAAKDDDSGERNKCAIVWEGMVKTRAFSEMIFKACPTEKFAREQFRKHNVEHYWDLAFSGAVLESTNM